MMQPPQHDATPADATAPANATAAELPLLGSPDLQRSVAWRNGQPVSARAFLAHVQHAAAQLPARGHVINLCEDRYAFLVGFCAALVRGQTTLLPPSRARRTVAAIRAAHPGCYCLADTPRDDAEPDLVQLAHPDSAPDNGPGRNAPMPRIARDHIAAIGYTSGSTGKPQASIKTWGSYAASTLANLAMLRGQLGEPLQLLATVPSQHMYGMETAVLLPLFGNVAVHASQPLLPADVARSLAQLPAPRLLVTTPVHLRALVHAEVALPPLAGMLSATAPLPSELARAAEARFEAPLLEVFGSTETCVIATRRSAHTEAFTPYAGVHLQPMPDGTRVKAPQLAEAVILADIMELDAGGRFRLMGRRSDLLEMAGKRASLADLNQRLLAIDGVEDASIFQLEQADGLGVKRLAALVVAPTRSESELLAELRHDIDPVFLPRPLHKVAALPRNATGKLPRQALLALLRDTRPANPAG